MQSRRNAKRVSSSNKVWWTMRIWDAKSRRSAAFFTSKRSSTRVNPMSRRANRTTRRMTLTTRNNRSASTRGNRSRSSISISISTRTSACIRTNNRKATTTQRRITTTRHRQDDQREIHPHAVPPPLECTRHIACNTLNKQQSSTLRCSICPFRINAKAEPTHCECECECEEESRQRD